MNRYSLKRAERLRGLNRPAVDLFSGAGGVTLGVSNANYDVIFRSDPDRELTHKRNFPKIPLACEKTENLRGSDMLNEPESRRTAAAVRDCQPIASRRFSDPTFCS